MVFFAVMGNVCDWSSCLFDGMGFIRNFNGDDKLKFYEVQKALEEGNKIRRTSWNSGSYIVLGTKEQYGKPTLIYHILTKNSASGGAYKLDTDAIFADDWEIIEPNHDSPLQEHKKYLEQWKKEIESLMEKEENTNFHTRSLKYQELLMWSIRIGVIEECLEHINELEK